MPSRLKASSAVVVLAAGVSLAAQQADRSRTESLARRGADRLQQLQAEAERLAAEERTLLGELQKLELEREIRTEQLRQASMKADEVAVELAALNDNVSRLVSENLVDRPAIRARIVELYKLGQARYLRLLLDTSDVRRLGEASRMVAALAIRDSGRISTYRRRLDELNATRAILQTREHELSAIREEAQRAQQATDRAVAARAALVRRIDNERDLNAALAGELQTAQQKLQSTLREIAAGATPREPPALPLKPFRGGLEWPVAGNVAQRFGQVTGRAAVSRGIQVSASEGAKVSAVHDGTVAFAGPYTGFGNLVILDHGAGNFSLYGNLLEIAAESGARLNQGEIVGTVGTSALGATGLYFELRVDGQPVDPLQWLKKR